MNLIPYFSNRVSNSSTELADLLGWSAPAAVSPFRFHDDKDHYFAEIDLPGVKKESVQLDVEGDQLTLTAERALGFGDAKRTVTITRGLTLPEDVQVDAIRADLRDGVLTLTFPKKEESKPKQLKINLD